MDNVKVFDAHTKRRQVPNTLVLTEIQISLTNVFAFDSLGRRKKENGLVCTD